MGDSGAAGTGVTNGGKAACAGVAGGGVTSVGVVDVEPKMLEKKAIILFLRDGDRRVGKRS
jgi:hypothetical protein